MEKGEGSLISPMRANKREHRVTVLLIARIVLPGRLLTSKDRANKQGPCRLPLDSAKIIRDFTRKKQKGRLLREALKKPGVRVDKRRPS